MHPINAWPILKRKGAWKREAGILADIAGRARRKRILDNLDAVGAPVVGDKGLQVAGKYGLDFELMGDYPPASSYLEAFHAMDVLHDGKCLHGSVSISAKGCKMHERFAELQGAVHCRLYGNCLGCLIAVGAGLGKRYREQIRT